VRTKKGGFRVPKVFFHVSLPAKTRKKANIYISSCDVLDIHSQGYSERESRQNLIEAVKLFITTCFERGTLNQALKECGFQALKTTVKPSRDRGFITVPIPFNAKGSCLSECRA
jgi:predicted RNase H-like HicB family nuclease